MSLNLEHVKPYCDHPESLEEVYEVALKASESLPEEYIFIETGTRSGGSALAILQAIRDSGRNRWLFTVDPYGMKPYNVAEEVVTLDYGEDHYRNAMKALADFAFENRLLHSHFRMKSVDWMKSFDASEFWYEGQRMKPKFGFAYLDGDHDSVTVMSEYIWLKNHSKDVKVVVDDAHYLNEDVLKLGIVSNHRLFMGAKGGQGITKPKTV